MMSRAPTILFLSETFFEVPDAVHREYPAAYAQLKAFYKQDPLLRLVRG